MRVTFEIVKIKAVRKWTDVAGIKRQRTKVFIQTLNPFNKDAGGNVKTRDQIMAELIAQRDAWLSSKDEA